MTSPSRPIIVGAGISGLVAAWELVRAGRPPLVLESGPRPGGNIGRRQVGGLDLDSGAESFATSTPTVTRLVADLGLSDQMVHPNPDGAWVMFAGGAAPLPPGGLLGIPARPWSAPVRSVVGTVGALRASADRVLPRRAGRSPGTLGALVRARMGERVVRRLVDPVAGGVYSTDPDELPVDLVNPRLSAALDEHGSLARAVAALRSAGLRPGSAVAGLVGGMYELVRTLEAEILTGGGTLRYDSPVRSLRRTETTSGWRVDWTGPGGAEAGDTDRVVVATDGPAAAAQLAGVVAGLPTTRSSEVRLVTLVVDRAELAGRRGTGVLIASGTPGVVAKALTHGTTKWPWLAARADAVRPGRQVVRLSYGRGEDLPGEAELQGQAVRDAAVILGVPEATIADGLADSAVVRWAQVAPRWEPGHRSAVERFRQELPPGLAVIGAHLAGTGLAAVVADAREHAEAG